MNRWENLKQVDVYVSRSWNVVCVCVFAGSDGVAEEDLPELSDCDDDADDDDDQWQPVEEADSQQLQQQVTCLFCDRWANSAVLFFGIFTGACGLCQVEDTINEGKTVVKVFWVESV